MLPDAISRKLKHEGECWTWTGCLVRGGYGQVTVDRRRHYVHRFVYETLVGPIAEGLEIDHLCRNRACANPAHLEPVTHAENMARSERATKTHCVHGHALTVENVYREGNSRKCRICRRERLAQFRARALAAATQAAA